MLDLLQVVALFEGFVFALVTLIAAFYGVVLTYHFYRFGLSGDRRGWVFVAIYGTIWLVVALFGVVLVFTYLSQ